MSKRSGASATARSTNGSADREAIGTVSRQIASLASKSTDALASQYEALTGKRTNSRNKQSLIRRVANAIQAQAFGGLSHAAQIRISELGDTLPDAWRDRLMQPANAPQPANMDPRLPPVGATLTREYKGKVHTVTILAAGFEHDGQTYKTLSDVAIAITGKHWSGYRFFKIEK
jgi:hypothetical protein